MMNNKVVAIIKGEQKWVPAERKWCYRCEIAAYEEWVKENTSQGVIGYRIPSTSTIISPYSTPSPSIFDWMFIGGS